METINQALARQEIQRLFRLLFKNDKSQPFELTDSQADFALTIFTKKFPRNQIIAPTQWGKSDVIAMSVLLRAVTFNEPWGIISTSMDKSMIIMGRIIQHCFDNKLFYDLLELDPNMPLDRLKRERSREVLSFQGGAVIRAFTANAKNRQSVKEALTGFGSPNIIEDEASLIPDDVQVMVMRMLGGHREQFLLKVGNPFYRNHFYRTWKNDKYNRIFIDYKLALKEGRYSEDFIEEMRDEAFFDVLYECKFPERDNLLTGGYKSLISESLLESAFVTPEEAAGLMRGRCRLGGDFAGGGNDRTAYVLRWPKLLMLHSTNRNENTMDQIPIIQKIAKQYSIESFDISLDYGGLGQGVGDRFTELGFPTNNIRFGQSAPDGEQDKYTNIRAYMYYKLARWLKKGGRIVRDNSFLELLSVNYKSDSERKLKIQSKEDLKKVMRDLGIREHSPDVADAAALTFASNAKIITEDDFEMV